MAGRYSNTPIIDGRAYGSWVDPTRVDIFSPDVLEDVPVVDHVLIAGERMDMLAHRYYGDDQLWWVIAAANRIVDPFSLTSGMTLRIPLDARNILRKLGR